MPSSFLSRSLLFASLLSLQLTTLQALQIDPPTDRCTSDGSCYFGGTCPDPSVGTCSCTTNFRGTLCAEFTLGACGQVGKYPVLQRENPTVKPVTCNNCDSSCYMCGGPTAQDCTECNLPQLLQNHQCVDSCSDGYYKSEAYYCEPCELSCGTCSGGLRNQCLTCGTESYYKLFVAALSECHVICPEGYYEATSTTCSACDSTCSECVTNSASECFTCPTGRFLYDHQCVTSCPTGTTANNGVCTSNCPSGQFTTTAGTADCSACSSVCASCTGTAITDCIECASGNYLILDVADNNSTCSATCPSGMWADTTNMICRNCPPHCATCTSNGRICTSCESGFFQVFGTCVSACPATYYSETGGNVCYQCHFTCGACSSFSATACTSCIQSTAVPNWPYTILFNNQCLNACPASHVLVNNQCIQNCNTNQYAFGGVCNTCPTTLDGVTDSDQISAILAGCSITLTTTADQTKVEEANTITYTTVSITLSSNDAVTSSESIVDAAASRNAGQNGQVTTTASTTTIIVYNKRQVSTIADQSVTIDNVGKENTGAQISVTLPSEISSANGNRCVSANTFRNNLYTTGSTISDFTPPAVDVRIYNACTAGATEEAISSLTNPVVIVFALNGNIFSNPFRCQAWNPTTNAWEPTGITTQANSNSKTATCRSTHLTSFTIREAATGTDGAVTFLLAGDFVTQLFPILLALAFVLIAVVAVIFDCYGKRGQNDKFPHRAHSGRYRHCLTIYRYSLLYNLPFVNIYGYFHLVVWCLYKTIWLSFLVWLMVIIEVSVFKEDVGSSSIGTMFVTAALCGLLLIPNSFTHWILIKRQKVKARYDPQASERTLKNIMPDASQPIEVDIMSDREIKLFDRKNPGKPDLSKVQEQPPTRRGFTQIQDQEIMSSIGLFLIIIFAAVAWGVGFGLSLVFGSDINTRNGDHYARFIGCFLLSIFFGIVYGILKLALASCCVTRCRKGRNQKVNRCRMCFFVDTLTRLIFEDFDTGNVKDPKKRNNRVGIVRQSSGSKKSNQGLKTSSNLLKPGAPAQPKPKPKSSVKTDLSARV